MTPPSQESGKDSVAAALALADRHERVAIDLAQNMDGGSVAKAAAHFTVAAGLRSRARFVR